MERTEQIYLTLKIKMMALSKEILDGISYAEKMGFDKLHLLPPPQTREAMKRAPKIPNPTKVGEVVDLIIPQKNIPVRIYIPEGEGPFPVISYFHGGGFVLMSIDSHDEITRQLAAKSDSVVMSVGYRLAPENPYPAALQDSVEAVKWMIENAGLYKGIGSKMAVAGDSAGGYMALFTAQKLKAEGINLKAQVAAYPVTDHYSAQHPSWEENKQGYILSAEMMRWFWDSYITAPTQFEAASPLRSKDFSQLPPAFIATANYDPLRDEGKAYADKLKAAGVQVVYKNYENVHGFFGIGEMGQQVMAEAIKFLQEKLDQ
jgi:acetyl esterase